MKIFNWVHRRFHHKDEFDRDVKKAEFIAEDTDTQALLEHIAIADGWREGILNIGTFGFDPFVKDFNQQQEEEEEEDDEEEEEEFSVTDECDEEVEVEDEEELNPLVFTAFKHGLEKETSLDCDQKNASKADLILTLDGVPLSSRLHQEDENNSECDQRKKKGERITLADLFSADSEVETKPIINKGKVQRDYRIKKLAHAKNGLSFAKKLIPGIGEDSRPILKLHRLMTRMMKRKIHPDPEGKIHKEDIEGNEASEIVRLLPTQDAVI